MGINHHPLRHKRVNALHQLQGAAPLLFNTFLAKIAKVLALGADMHNTFCLARGRAAGLTPHFGDLGEEGVAQQGRSALRLAQSLYASVPHRAVARAPLGYR
ncbi:hypothetical protein, partial [Klebsiella pneumoniae]|uniref:hypothetical protein n=1 Tax=Klebsiella pneumoniae TaxID=573 RepID=UPI00159D2AF8